MKSLLRKQLRIKAVVPEITQPLELMHMHMQEILSALQLWATKDHSCPCSPASPSGEDSRPLSDKGQRPCSRKQGKAHYKH